MDHKVLSHIGFESPTLGVVESGVATVYITGPTMQCKYTIRPFKFKNYLFRLWPILFIIFRFFFKLPYFYLLKFFICIFKYVLLQHSTEDKLQK